VFFCDFHLQSSPGARLEIDQDNLQTGTAKAVAQLISFAQITCIVYLQCQNYRSTFSGVQGVVLRWRQKLIVMISLSVHMMTSGQLLVCLVIF